MRRSSRCFFAIVKSSSASLGDIRTHELRTVVFAVVYSPPAKNAHIFTLLIILCILFLFRVNCCSFFVAVPSCAPTQRQLESGQPNGTQTSDTMIEQLGYEKASVQTPSEFHRGTRCFLMVEVRELFFFLFVLRNVSTLLSFETSAIFRNNRILQPTANTRKGETLEIFHEVGRRMQRFSADLIAANCLPNSDADFETFDERMTGR